MFRVERKRERERERLVRKLLVEESSFESNERGEKEDRGGVLIKTRTADDGEYRVYRFPLIKQDCRPRDDSRPRDIGKERIEHNARFFEHSINSEPLSRFKLFQLTRMPFYESPLETHQSSFLPIDLERAIFNLFDYRSIVKLILNSILLSFFKFKRFIFRLAKENNPSYFILTKRVYFYTSRRV